MITIKTLDVGSIYDDVKRSTNGFRFLKPEIIEEKPQRLIIFRLILGFDQRSMANFLGKSQGTVWSIERGIRKINPTLAAKVINQVKKVKSIPTKNDLIQRHSEIANRGKFYGDYAKKMSLKAPNRSVTSAILAKPTLQEANLIALLNKEKIKFQFHGVLESSRKFVVDFVFPSEKTPKLIVEVKELKSIYRKRLAAIDLAYRAIKIRQKHPKIKLIAIIDGDLQGDASSIIGEEYNKLILNSSPENSLKVIRQYLK